MVVKNELAAEFKIQLLAVLLDSLSDGCGLFFQIFLVVKSDLESHAMATY